MVRVNAVPSSDDVAVVVDSAIVKRGRGRPKGTRKQKAGEWQHSMPPIPRGGVFISWDIETGPLDDETLFARVEPFAEPPHPGEFSLDSVKTGNLKDPDKIAQKVREASDAHTARCLNHVTDCQFARAAWQQEIRDRAALDATLGRVVAIGLDLSGVKILGSDLDEPATIKCFWEYVAQSLASRTPMVGFNIHGFDLPFLVRRSWLLDIPIPAGVRHGRYWNDLFVDLMKVWTFDGYGQFVKLDTLAKSFGLPGKTEGVEAKDFHRLWTNGGPVERTNAIEYLTADVMLVKELAVRMNAV